MTKFIKTPNTIFKTWAEADAVADRCNREDDDWVYQVVENDGAFLVAVRDENREFVNYL